MQRQTLLLSSQCRRSLSSPGLLKASIPSLTFRRGRQTKVDKRKQAQIDFRNAFKSLNENTFSPLRSRESDYEPSATAFLSEDADAPPELWLEAKVKEWATLPMVLDRICDFGLGRSDAKSLLLFFSNEARSGRLSTPQMNEECQMWRLGNRDPSLNDGRGTSPTDVALTIVFLLWVTSPLSRSTILKNKVVRNNALDELKRVMEAADIGNPINIYPKARKLKRKFIMHVGPTNSGKTHHALRALAASKNGVYAGPLRLLAHEIFERLNFGQIAPLGMDQNEQPEEITSAIAGVETKVRVVRRGNPKFSRKCNMITGEEVKIVAEDAPLTSCTVEMLNIGRMYEVAVIDEIQMIADSQRGFGWTTAVLAVCASEVHLCGEETAVPLIEKLLQDTGDTLEVRRYERLSPLTVEDDALDGNWSKIQKGDCIVTFARKNIFSIKNQVEKKTGLRCAVVYGNLPPEIRSEQAALFNDPDSGYDVMVGTDAIGMGLNLKIRRIVFESIRKWHSNQKLELSDSQIKQIAGRAGRFRLQLNEDDEPGGFVTTLKSEDLPVLAKALQARPKPLAIARLPPDANAGRVAAALPASSTLSSICNVVMFGSLVPPPYQHADIPVLDKMSEMLSLRGRENMSFTLPQKLLFCQAPIPWREDILLDRCIRPMMQMMRDELHVDIERVIERVKFRKALSKVEKVMERFERKEHTAQLLIGFLKDLEGFHKILVLYMWMSFRQPVTFSQVSEVGAYKLRTEYGLEWLLETISKLSLEEEEDSDGAPKAKAEREKVEVMNVDPQLRKFLRDIQTSESGLIRPDQPSPSSEKNRPKWFTDM